MILGIAICSFYPNLPKQAFVGVKNLAIETGVRDSAVNTLKEMK
jgi:hypothetical protein